MDKRISVVLPVISFIVLSSMALVCGEEAVRIGKQQGIGKIGYADFLTIYHSYNQTKEEDKRLKERGDELQKKIDAEREKISKLEKKMASGILSEEEKKKLTKEIEEAKRQVNRKIKDYNLEINSERRETIDKLIRQLRSKITRFGEEQGYTIIFDTKDLLFADTNLDLTKEIVDYVNREVNSEE